MKQLAVLIISLLLAELCMAQFANHTQISPISKRVRSAHGGDMDGDGDLDVVASSMNDGKVVWYENDGQGKFIDHHVILDTDEAYRLITVFDFDYNGFADIITGGHVNGDSQTRLWLNQGLTISSPVVLNLPTNFSSISKIYSFDVNVDGYMDVVLVHGDIFAQLERVCWLKNNGLGEFTETIEISIPIGSDIDNVFDFNGDSLVDVFIEVSSDELVCLVNDSAGYLFHLETLPYGIETVHGSGDMDNDGDLDLVVRGSEAGTSSPILWLKNDGTGHFTTSHTLVSSSANNGYGVKVLDLDGLPGPEVLVPRGGLRLYHGSNTNYTMLTELSAPLKTLEFQD
ncbi:MAG: hypothetical protein RL266_785, partial [Bacteroidota bacterium]